MDETLTPLDFLENEILVGDEVAFFALGYRMFTKGIVLKITPKMLFIKYDNTWNYDHHEEETKQEHKQIIDLTALNRRAKQTGRWIDTTRWWQGASAWKRCSVCGILSYKHPYCPNCGAHMIGGEDEETD